MALFHAMWNGNIWKIDGISLWNGKGSILKKMFPSVFISVLVNRAFISYIYIYIYLN